MEYLSEVRTLVHSCLKHVLMITTRIRNTLSFFSQKSGW